MKQGVECFTILISITGWEWKGWMNAKQIISFKKKRKEKKVASYLCGGWWSLSCPFSFRSSPGRCPVKILLGGWGWVFLI